MAYHVTSVETGTIYRGDNKDILMAYHVTSRPQKPGESARVTYSSVTHICRSDVLMVHILCGCRV